MRRHHSDNVLRIVSDSRSTAYVCIKRKFLTKADRCLLFTTLGGMNHYQFQYHPFPQTGGSQPLVKTCIAIAAKLCQIQRWFVLTAHVNISLHFPVPNSRPTIVDDSGIPSSKNMQTAFSHTFLSYITHSL